MRNGRRHRGLFAIDAPEMKQSCDDNRGARYTCRQTARNALAPQVGGASVTCEPVDRGQCGRTVVRCYAHGEDLNRWMVASGWAVAYRQFSRVACERRNRRMPSTFCKQSSGRAYHAPCWAPLGQEPRNKAPDYEQKA